MENGLRLIPIFLSGTKLYKLVITKMEKNVVNGIDW